jgi:taurine dioxygenase
VRHNERTGRDALFVSRLLTDAIVDLPRADSDHLLDALFDVLYDPARVLVHRWEVGDLVLWENLEVQHARGDFDRAHRRVLRRVIAGDEAMHDRHNIEFAAQRSGRAGTGPVLV